MVDHYEITFRARHLWTTIIVALGMIILAFLLGIWVGSFSSERSQETSVAAVEDVTQTAVTPSLPPASEDASLDTLAPPPLSGENPAQEITHAKPSPKPPDEKPATAPVSPKKAEPSQPSGVHGKWTVQVIALAHGNKAQVWLQKLLASGYNAYMETLTYPRGKKIYRIRVGAYPTREKADAAQRKLAGDPILVKNHVKPLVVKR